MKRKIILLLCMVITMVFGGCGKNEVMITSSQESNSKEIVEQGEKNLSEISMKDIYDEIAKNVGLIEPMDMPEDYIENYYDIDVALLEDYVFSISESATSAETLILVKVKDEKDAEHIMDGIQLVINEKKAEMENYLPDQFDLVNRSSVQHKNQYLWLVISEHDAEMNQIISSYIK